MEQTLIHSPNDKSKFKETMEQLKVISNQPYLWKSD